MFWQDFLSNFLSDLIAGGIIGTALALYVGKRLGNLERSQEQIDKHIADRERAIQYLTLLLKEIVDLKASLPVALEQFVETGWGREIQIDTPFWETVDRSGELPRLLHPNMVRYLTRFYQKIAFARRGRDLLIESWLVNPDNVPGMKLKQAAFMRMTESGLRDAISTTDKILEHVRDNITILEEQVRILQEQE